MSDFDDVKIQDLTELSSAANSDEFVVDDISANATKKITLSNINSSLTHDSLSGINANEHIDWTSDQGATNIDAGNITGLTIGTQVTGASTDLTDAADITYNADTDVSGNNWVLDEDDFSSDSATKVPTQQSVKAYFDANAVAGQAIALDLGDDDSNESDDLGEIAVTNDTNSIFTEPSDDKLLIDASNNWPTADNINNGTLSTSGGTITTSSGDITINPAGDLDLNSNNVKDVANLAIGTNTAGSTPLTVVETSGTGSSVVAEFANESASPANGDEAHIQVELFNNNDQRTEVAQISYVITDVTNNSEAGRIDFQTMSGGSLSEVIRFESGGTISMDGGTTSISSSELNLLDGKSQLLENVVDDTSPQLGGNLDSNGNSITSFVSENTTDSASKSVGTFKGSGRTTPADGDEIYVDFSLEDDSPADQTYGRIKVIAKDVSSGVDDGQVLIQALTGGTLTNILGLGAESSTSGDVITAYQNFNLNGNNIYTDSVGGTTISSSELALLDGRSALIDTAGDGLSKSSNTLNVDINGTTDLASPASGDEILVADISNSNAIRKTDLQTAVDNAISSASTSTSGAVELATSAETTTGTDTSRAVTPDGLAGSDYGKRVIEAQIVGGATDVSTGDGAGNFRFFVPEELDGYNLVNAHAAVVTAGTTGTTDIQLHNVTDSVDMLSTKITIDSGEKTSYTAATPPSIDGTNDDVATGDEIRVDVDAVSSTAPKGLSIILTFQLP